VRTYAIIGGTVWGNRGAEAMVATTIGRLRERDPDARFLLLSYQPARDRGLVDDPRIAVVDGAPRRLATVHLPWAVVVWLVGRVGLRVPGWLLPRDLAALRGSRVLLDVSGISFHDGRLGVMVYNLACLWPAMLLGVPVVRLSQAMGPFEHRINRLAARHALRRSARSYLRGARTAALVEPLGVDPARWRLAADLAFAYRPQDRLAAEHLDRVEAAAAQLAAWKASGAAVVAVVPSSLVLKGAERDGWDYLGALEALVVALRDRGYRVLLLPNATSEGVDTLRNNDLAVITRLATRFPAIAADDGVVRVEHDLDTASIRQLLRSADATVTSRFHAMVASLSLGIPVLVLGWSHKYAEVLAPFGLEDDAVPAEEALGTEARVREVALPRLWAFLDDLERRRHLIEAALPTVEASAAAQLEELDELLGGLDELLG
jgi:polysaccharide pyruvyl transferase WcaK-like protein